MDRAAKFSRDELMRTCALYRVTTPLEHAGQHLLATLVILTRIRIEREQRPRALHHVDLKRRAAGDFDK
ncbi:hypothetical protein PPN31119_04554 [Pandoraea pnomenusa]|uniref:Uncharacterized protein n=1 Tax=Pandoraea pnomenusa TaxID=93220 RepID=A0ABY6WQB4_9BURK|nr:hypothetical protein [Pandoraea pnomenusa]VVE73249.1 hypothetical protein PPN31119_04554 [Pandoraea pnomenusa]